MRLLRDHSAISLTDASGARALGRERITARRRCVRDPRMRSPVVCDRLPVDHAAQTQTKKHNKKERRRRRGGTQIQEYTNLEDMDKHARSIADRGGTGRARREIKNNKDRTKHE